MGVLDEVNAARERLRDAQRKALETPEAKELIRLYINLNDDDERDDDAKRNDDGSSEMLAEMRCTLAELARSVTTPRHDTSEVAKEISQALRDLRAQLDDKFAGLESKHRDDVRALEGSLVTKIDDTTASEREKALEMLGSRDHKIMESLDTHAKQVSTKIATLCDGLNELRSGDAATTPEVDSKNTIVSVARDLTCMVESIKTCIESNFTVLMNAISSQIPPVTDTATTGDTRLPVDASENVCMAVQNDGSRCGKKARVGFVTCGYASHKAQDEELAKVHGRNGSTNASMVEESTGGTAGTIATKRATTRPSSRLREGKRKRDEERAPRHTHEPDGRIHEGCDLCAQGGNLTVAGLDPSKSKAGPILASESEGGVAENAENEEEIEYTFDSPGRPFPIAFPMSPTMNGPLLAPPSSDTNTGFRNDDELMQHLRSSRSNNFKRTPQNFIDFRKHKQHQ